MLTTYDQQGYNSTVIKQQD